jgi:transposase-like protein
MVYAEKFKAKIVRRLVGPRAITATQLAKEVGISQATLSKWLRERGRPYPVVNSDSEDDGSVVELRRPRRPQDWPAAERLEAVLEASALGEENLGAFLRSKGLHEADLAEWRRAALEALGGDQPGRKAKPVDAKRFKELEREVKSLGADLRRKEKALAEVTALLVLKKKLDALHLDEDDDDPGRSGK